MRCSRGCGSWPGRCQTEGEDVGEHLGGLLHCVAIFRGDEPCILMAGSFFSSQAVGAAEHWMSKVYLMHLILSDILGTVPMAGMPETEF